MQFSQVEKNAKKVADQRRASNVGAQSYEYLELPADLKVSQELLLSFDSSLMGIKQNRKRETSQKFRENSLPKFCKRGALSPSQPNEICKESLPINNESDLNNGLSHPYGQCEEVLDGAFSAKAELL